MPKLAALNPTPTPIPTRVVTAPVRQAAPATAAPKVVAPAPVRKAVVQPAHSGAKAHRRPCSCRPQGNGATRSNPGQKDRRRQARRGQAGRRAALPKPATERIGLSGNVSLVGVFAGADGRHALVRLPNGNVEKVSAGDRVQGMQVAAINADSVRVTGRGRDTLLPPARLQASASCGPPAKAARASGDASVWCAPPTRRRACRRRSPAPRPCPSRCRARRPPPGTSGSGSCGRSRPGSSGRCSARRSALAQMIAQRPERRRLQLDPRRSHPSGISSTACSEIGASRAAQAACPSARRDQILAHLDQHVRQPAPGPVPAHGVALELAGIGLVVPDAVALRPEPRDQRQRQPPVVVPEDPDLPRPRAGGP